MRLFLARGLVLLGLAVGCGATTQSLRSEYALDPGAHPESVDCFYSCLKEVQDDLRRSCLSLCDGVEVTETYAACSPGAPTLCRSYPVREPFPKYEAEPDEYEDDGDDIAGDIVGAIFVGIFKAALGVDDDEDDCDYDDGDDERVRVREGSPKRDSKPRLERAPKPSGDRRGRPRKGK
jgi:hypothetical protein